MPLYELAFVDSIASSPVTRLDLNDGSDWTVLAGTRFDPPTLKRAVVSTLMYDGSRYPASAYEDRVLTLILGIGTRDADEAATQLQALARELDRETNFLRYKPLTTNAVFFRTHRSDFSQITYDEDNKQVAVSVLAEPFALGLAEPANTISNTNPGFETDLTGWGGANSTIERSLTQAYAGVASVLVTPVGGTTASLVTDAAYQVPVYVGTSYLLSSQVYSPGGWAIGQRIGVNWFDASSTFLTTTFGGTVATPAGVWTSVTSTVTAPAGAVYARITLQQTGLPTSGDVWFADEVIIRPASQITVTNNPAATINPMVFHVAHVKGDVETPLWMRLDTSTANDVTVLATRRWGDYSLVPYVLQAEAMDSGGDTALQANSSNYSGAGQNYQRTSFATDPGVAGRLSITLPDRYPGQTEEARGTYRLFARTAKTVAGDNIRVRFVYGSTNAIVGDWVTLPSSTNRTWVDLGQVVFPVGADPIYEPHSSTRIPVLGSDLYFDAERVSGSGGVDWDVFLFFPADDQFAVISEPAVPMGDAIWDGTRGLLYYESEGDSDELCVTSAMPIQLQGPDAIMVSPGDNAIYMGILFEPGTQSGLTQSTTVTVQYWPRYVHVAPVST